MHELEHHFVPGAAGQRVSHRPATAQLPRIFPALRLRAAQHGLEPAMRCPECRHENPLDYRFCGSCGRPRTASAALLTPAGAGAAGAQPSPAPALTAYAAPPTAETSLANQDAPTGGSSDSGPDRNVTRYLCAAVNMNEGIARAAIEDVLEE